MLETLLNYTCHDKGAWILILNPAMFYLFFAEFNGFSNIFDLVYKQWKGLYWVSHPG